MANSLEKQPRDLSLGSIYGKQNEHMIYALAKAYSVVLELVGKHDLTVLNVTVEDSKPVITIEKKSLDESLFCYPNNPPEMRLAPGSVLEGLWGSREIRGTKVQWLERTH